MEIFQTKKLNLVNLGSLLYKINTIDLGKIAIREIFRENEIYSILFLNYKIIWIIHFKIQSRDRFIYKLNCISFEF